MRTLLAPLGLRAAAASLVLLLPARAGNPTDGFQLESLPWPGQSLAASLSTGEIVTFDGLSVDLWSADGTHLSSLATLPSSAFASFVEIEPAETFALIGENSNGEVYRVPLPGGGLVPVATLPFNYDAAFEDSGAAIVSANLGGIGTGNDLVRLDVQTGATTPLAKLSGPSGPVAVDAFGNLLYATQSEHFPPPPGSTDVLLFLKPLLDGGTVLSESDAIVFGGGFEGGSRLAADDEGGVYLAEVSFGTVGRVVRVNGGPSSSLVVYDGQGTWIDGLEFRGEGPAAFLPYQPESGGTLTFTRTDFGALNERLAVRPARPQASLSGPGIAGPGPFSLHVEGGVPGGSFAVVFGPQSHYATPETPVLLPGLPPLFTGLDLATLLFLPGAFPLDGSGAATLDFWNPGGLEGALAAQALVFHPLAFPVGTSTAVLN